MISAQKLFALILTYCLYYHSVNFIRAELQLVARKTENKKETKNSKPGSIEYGVYSFFLLQFNHRSGQAHIFDN